MQGIVPVEFHGDRVQTWQHEDGKIYVLVASVCRNLGIDPAGQRVKLKRSPFFQRHLKTSDSSSLGGRGRDPLSLNNDYLPAWLANISVEKVKWEIRDKLLLYQEECAQVLREYWMGSGVVVNPRVINLPALESREYAARYLESSVRIDAQFGYPRHITLQESVKAILADTGLDLSEKLALSPYCEDIKPEEVYLEPDDLNKRFHLPRGLINAWLGEKGYQVKQGNGAWAITPKAEALGLGRPHAWSRNKHEGYNVKWQVRFIEEHLDDIRHLAEILA